MPLKELSDGGPDGSRFGQSTTDKIAFHGSTPISQRTSANLSSSVTAFAVGGTSLITGLTLSAAVQQIADALIEIRATIVAYGLHKGGA